MIRQMLGRAAASLGLCAALAACSSDQQQGSAQLALLDGLRATVTPRAEPFRVSPEVVARALAASDQALWILEQSRQGSQTLLGEVGRNGPYVTLATGAQQTVALRAGFVTGTRGLTGDIMSSDVDALLPLILRGTGGTAPYTARVITANDTIRTIDFVCVVTPFSGLRSVRLGPVSTTGRAVTTDCNADDGLRITNEFLVSEGGIVHARQWVGVEQGYIAFQRIRG